MEQSTVDQDREGGKTNKLAALHCPEKDCLSPSIMCKNKLTEELDWNLWDRYDLIISGLEDMLASLLMVPFVQDSLSLSKI